MCWEYIHLQFYKRDNTIWNTKPDSSPQPLLSVFWGWPVGFNVCALKLKVHAGTLPVFGAGVSKTSPDWLTYTYSGHVSVLNHVEDDHVKQIHADLESQLSHIRNVQQVDVTGVFLQLLFLSSTGTSILFYTHIFTENGKKWKLSWRRAIFSCVFLCFACSCQLRVVCFSSAVAPKPTNAPLSLIPEAPAPSKSPICPAMWERAGSLVKMAQISVTACGITFGRLKQQSRYCDSTETAQPQMKWR